MQAQRMGQLEDEEGYDGAEVQSVHRRVEGVSADFFFQDQQCPLSGAHPDTPSSFAGRFAMSTPTAYCPNTRTMPTVKEHLAHLAWQPHVPNQPHGLRGRPLPTHS